jgi:hypothetical protein
MEITKLHVQDVAKNVKKYFLKSMINDIVKGVPKCLYMF